MNWLQIIATWLENISTIDLVAGSVFIGLILALTSMFMHKYSIGKLISKMEKGGIHTPDKAMTLRDLGAGRTARAAITDGSSVRRLFGYVLGDQIIDNPRAPLPKANGRKDLSAARFYLLPSKHNEAVTRFPARGNSALSLVLCIVLLTVGFYVIREYLPTFLEFLSTSAEAIGG